MESTETKIELYLTPREVELAHLYLRRLHFDEIRLRSESEDLAYEIQAALKKLREQL